jgi:hypothetical protein
MQKLLLICAISFGLVIAYFDSRPNWDDTGLSAGILLITCLALGALEPKRPWLWAIAVGIWIPAYGILVAHNFSSLLALAFAFTGAYLGMALRKLVMAAVAPHGVE